MQARFTMIALFFSFGLMAQEYSFVGQILDKDSKQPIEFASVSVLSKDSVFLTGSVSDKDGRFDVKGVKEPSTILKFQFIGYQTLIFTPKTLKKGNVETVFLSASFTDLQEVTVTGERKTQTVQLDKQVFSTKQFQNAANGTGLDLVARLPSVTVNTEGSVLLRGSASFMVLLNGKPTNRAAADVLAQIPANLIESVEVITSPSAKYDADGKTGIINIVTKKDATLGWSLAANGMFGGANPERWGSDFNANYTGKKGSFYIGGDYRRFDYDGYRRGVVRTIVRDTLTFLPSDGIRNYNDFQYGIRVGGTFAPTAKDVFNVGYYVGKKQTDRTANLHYDEFILRGSNLNLFSTDFGKPTLEFFNQNLFVRSGAFQMANLDYTHSFKNKSKIAVLGIYEHSELGGPLNNVNDFEDTKTTFLHERTNEISPLNAVRFQTDFSTPLANNRKFEAGYQFRFVRHEGDFIFETLDIPSKTWKKDPEFNDALNLQQTIHAAYANLNGTVKKWAYNLGLRGEYMDRTLTHRLGEKPFLFKKLDLFPSLQALRQYENGQTLRFAYARRIDRPTTKLMSPFKNHRHAETIELGDPNLRPEIADVVEAAFSRTFGAVALTTTAYFNHTKDKVFRVNDIYNRTILWRTYTNAGTATSLGLEASAEVKLTNWWRFYASGNVFNFNVKGNPNGLATDQTSLNFNANGNMSFDITKQLRFQWDANYIGRTVTTQGLDSDYFLSNMGIRYGFSKNRATLGLQCQNVFNTNIQTIGVQAPNFYSTTDYIKYDRVLMLSLGVRFNDSGKKAKALKTEYGEKDF